MKKLIIVLSAAVITLTTGSVFAGGGNYVVDKAHLNMSDKASLQNGAKLFVNYCLSCHSASYARYNRVAEDLEIPVDLLKESLMFTTEKTGDLMTTTMPVEDAKEWFGVAPPDLTLVSRVRKPDWVYTYLRAFYQDENSPSGWNNSLFQNVAMPHAMYELQGVQKYIGKADLHGEGHDDAHGADAHAGDADHDDSQKVVGDAIFELAHPGKMTPEQFDDAMLDLTNFLAYLAEPAVMKRQSIGVYTIGFLIVLMILCYLLKLEFWRDVH